MWILQVRENKYCYKGRPRLNTAYQLLLVSLDLEKNLHQVLIFLDIFMDMYIWLYNEENILQTLFIN